MVAQYQSSYDKTYPITDLAPQFALAANTPLTYTVPGDSSKKYVVQFSYAYDANVWVALNTTATVPTAGTMSSNTRCELRPKRRFVQGGDVISFISNAVVSNAGFSLLYIPN